MVIFYYADPGKIFDLKDNSQGHFYSQRLCLGDGDSIQNYKEVDIAEYEKYQAEQEKKHKEEELRRLMLELYPPEEEDNNDEK